MRQSKERSRDDMLLAMYVKKKNRKLSFQPTLQRRSELPRKMQGPTSTSIVVHRLEFCSHSLRLFLHGLDRIPPSGARAAVGCASEGWEASSGWAGESGTARGQVRAAPGSVGAGIRGLIWIVVWLGRVAASLITLMPHTIAPHSCWSDRAVV